MPDMEKIIKDNAIRGLQNVIEISGELVHLRKEYAKVILELLKEQEDTINELQNAYGYLQKQFFEAQDKQLKEQEPTTFKPHYIDKYGKHFICGVECGSCHKEISSTYHYCPYCGRSVKWDA